MEREHRSHPLVAFQRKNGSFFVLKHIERLARERGAYERSRERNAELLTSFLRTIHALLSKVLLFFGIL